LVHSDGNISYVDRPRRPSREESHALLVFDDFMAAFWAWVDGGRNIQRSTHALPVSRVGGGSKGELRGVQKE
jgi:hypothetical protein